MKIGELAAAAHTPVETIRYYERAGLLPPAPRSPANYRVYGPAHVERLAFVRHCRSLDMALDEIRVLLRFKDAPHEDCGAVNVLLDEHISHVAARLRELKQLEKQLKALRASCSGTHDAAHCGILGELSEAAAGADGNPPRQHVPGAHGHAAGAARRRSGAGGRRGPSSA